MKHYIYDKEHEELMNIDGQPIFFKSDEEIYKYLSKVCGFTDEFIKSNFAYVKMYKILIPE